MPFIYKKKPADMISISSGGSSFTLEVKHPGVNALLEIYADYFEDSESTTSRGLPLELMRKLKDLLVTNSLDWSEVNDESGKPLEFKQQILAEMLETDMELFKSAINSAMDCFFARQKSAEKN
jgi:hypothetical protein